MWTGSNLHLCNIIGCNNPFRPKSIDILTTGIYRSNKLVTKDLINKKVPSYYCTDSMLNLTARNWIHTDMHLDRGQHCRISAYHCISKIVKTYDKRDNSAAITCDYPMVYSKYDGWVGASYLQKYLPNVKF